MGILIPLLLIFLTCLVIWRACDGFEIASEYIGRNLSEGVRGGTINAISSSVPELFTTLIALFVLSNEDGFSVGLGTTAGSAIFNSMVIPAACILSVVGAVVLGVRVNSVKVSLKVLLRDGLALIACEVLLIVVIDGQELYWWQGLVLMLTYFAYLAYMLLSMKPSSDGGEKSYGDVAQPKGKAKGSGGGLGPVIYWMSGGPLLNLEGFFVRSRDRDRMRQGTWNGWPLLLSSTAVIGAACWLLVKACEWLGTGPANLDCPNYVLCGWEFCGMGMPTMFVAVIFASMATSVPDTVISIRDARDGDYDDAVANALGSNVFDICFALGFPLFLYTALNGPIVMSPVVAQQSSEIRVLLLCLTVISFFVYFIGKRGVSASGVRYVEMGRGKAVILLMLYLGFVAYIVGRSQNADWAESISRLIRCASSCILP